MVFCGGCVITNRRCSLFHGTWSHPGHVFTHGSAHHIVSGRIHRVASCRVVTFTFFFYFNLMCPPYPQRVVKGDSIGHCVTNCFYLMTLSFDQSWPTFLTNHICSTLLHVLKTFESIMPLRRHIPKRRPKMTCPLKHRSQPGIPRDLKQFYMYYLWEASHVANYLKLWALFAVPIHLRREQVVPHPVSFVVSVLFIHIHVLHRYEKARGQTDNPTVACFLWSWQ